MQLPPWLRNLSAARRQRAERQQWKVQRARRLPALRSMELEERRVLAVTSITAAADIVGVDEGQALSNVSVASFQDPDALNTHSATINWGDGSSTAGTIQDDGGGQYTVLGSHTYGDDGDYNVQVTVEGQENVPFATQLTIGVDNVDPSLTVPADGSIVINEGQQVTIGNLGIFTDPGFLDTHTATIDWVDGTPVEAGVVTEANGSGKVAGTHTYGDDGNVTVKVTVLDDDGGETFKEFTLQVNNVAPSLTVPADDSIVIDEGQQVTIGNLGIFTDPGFLDTHTATIDWGDGTPVEAGVVTEANGSGKVAGTHTYGDNGTFTVKVTVKDDEGAETTKEFTLKVNNVDPSLTLPADNSIVVNEGQQVTIGNLGIFTDPGFLDTHTATIDWGDGTPVEAGIVTEANGSGKVAGTHTYGDNGTFTVKVTVKDDDGGETTKEFTLLVNNVAPTLTVPANNSIVVDEGDFLAIGNLGIFTDPGFLDTHTATIDWGDGTPVEAGIVTEANGSGKIAGTHVYGDNGTFTVKVTVKDDDGGETTKEFTILVNNVAPTLTVPANNSIVVDEGDFLAVGNLGIFTDPGFLDTHTATIDWGDGTPVEAGIVTEANGSGKIAGTHVYGDNGTFTVTVTVIDDDGGATTKTFTILVNNVAPSLTVPANNSIIADEGDTVTVGNLGIFTDPGFLDTHTATVDWGDGTPVEVGIVTEANGSGKIAGSHVYGDNGTFTVKVTVTDDDGGVTTKDFTILINNVAPTLTPTGNQMILAGVPLVLPVAGTFTDPGFLDTHTATVNWGDGSPVESAGVLQGPGFGSVAAGHIFATPGVFTVTLSVTDDDGGVDVQTFLVTVDAPILPPITPPFTPILPPNPFGETSSSDPGFTSAALSGSGNEDTVLNLYQPIDGGDDLASTNATRDEGAGAISPSATEKRFILVIVYADGTESEPVTIPDSDVSNLPGLWRRLPDNFYRVYQVQENGSLRLVTQGYVQGGQLADPNDKNETQDRPPTSQKQSDPASPQLTQEIQENESATVTFTRISLPVGANFLDTENFDSDASQLSPLEHDRTAVGRSSVARPAFEKAEQQEATFTTGSASASALLTTALAAGVLVRKQPAENWEQTIDQALERMPADWSKTKALWRMRKPR